MTSWPSTAWGSCCPVLRGSYPGLGEGAGSNGCALPALLGWLLSVWLCLTGLCWHQIDVLFVPDKDPKSPLGSSSNSFILPDCGIRAPRVPGDASIAELQAPRLLSAEMMEKLQEQLSFLPVCILFSGYQQDVFHQTPINLLRLSPASSVCPPLPEPASSLPPAASPSWCLLPCRDRAGGSRRRAPSQG